MTTPGDIDWRAKFDELGVRFVESERLLKEALAVADEYKARFEAMRAGVAALHEQAEAQRVPA